MVIRCTIGVRNRKSNRLTGLASCRVVDFVIGDHRIQCTQNMRPKVCLDQAIEVTSGLLNFLEVRYQRILAGIRCILFEHFGIPDDLVERRTKLMPDMRKRFRFEDCVAAWRWLVLAHAGNLSPSWLCIFSSSRGSSMGLVS